MSESFTIQVADSLRRFEPNSPRSSPRGNRSPVVPRQQDSTGTLKTTISLGKTPTIVHTGPFYLHKELPGDSDLTGATNLMAHYNLEHSYNKFSGKKFKDSLSSFLPGLPGMIDTPGSADNSSLRSIIEKPPIGGKELAFLNTSQLAGFRLHPGPLPEQYQTSSLAPQKKKQKHKKHKKSSEIPAQETGTGQAAPGVGVVGESGAGSGGESYEKKHKKQKRHEDEKDRKKKKKEKKKKKQKHSPEHPGASASLNTTTSSNNPTGMLPLL
uniref:Mediator of RNA polymerase II transcription subunit 19 n=1 Tax=Ceriodaphnia reticulata TaxID=302197 RepID=A0A4Y7LV07_9CRUS|nr:EOG090X0DK3 [Ceriodaphnia reticulata]SVE73190.1 EOG090X0DK3 [Ceriodaphnia reticulata]